MGDDRAARRIVDGDAVTGAGDDAAADPVAERLGEEGGAKGLTPGVDPEAIPACVNACIGRTLAFGDLDDPNSNVSRLLANNKHFRMHEDAGTGSGFYYLWDKGELPL